MAVQGGLLAATIAQSEEERLKENAKKGAFLPILAFLSAKLAAYTVLGFFLGLLGSTFKLTPAFSLFLQFAVVIFMLGTAFNILEIHPFFRYFVIQPPRFLTRFIRQFTRKNRLQSSRLEKDVFAPSLLGAFTVFIPCGTTQAIMALAIASGKPLSGAMILFAFILGTSPLFFILGYLATKLGDSLHQKFMKIAALGIIFLAVFNLNNAISLTGSTWTLNNVWQGFWCTFSICSDSQVTIQKPVDHTSITITDSGYSPDNFTVKAGSRVRVNLTNRNGGGCTQAFTIPSLGVQKIVPIGSSDSVTFIAPQTPGAIQFMCSMGMYRGTINVI